MRQDPLATAPAAQPCELISCPTGPLVVPAMAARPNGPVLSIVVPTLNEAENIRELLREATSVLDRELGGRYELIVVDDDSADRSWDAAASLAGELEHVRVIRR